VTDENSDLLAESHYMLNTRNKYFSRFLNVHRISDLMETEIHMTKPLVADPFEVEIATAKFKKYRSLK
jgi:hypothetical protein